MFLAQEPADVREKESAPGIVRIGVRVAKFVMDPVISTPLVDVILLKTNKERAGNVDVKTLTLPRATFSSADLESDRLRHSDQNTERKDGLKGAVRPEFVGTGGYAESPHNKQIVR